METQSSIMLGKTVGGVSNNVHYNNIIIIIMLNKVMTSGIMEHAQ